MTITQYRPQSQLINYMKSAFCCVVPNAGFVFCAKDNDMLVDPADLSNISLLVDLYFYLIVLL